MGSLGAMEYINLCASQLATTHCDVAIIDTPSFPGIHTWEESEGGCHDVVISTRYSVVFE